MTSLKVSIVSTIYNSNLTIKEFIERALNVGSQIANSDFEIIIVDDGSPDDSAQIVEKLALEKSNIKIVKLSRNFGHHRALLEGLRWASGELIFLIDSDLEERPEWLFDFQHVLRISKVESVYGYQKIRRGKFYQKLWGDFYWKIFIFLTGFQIPSNVVTARLMTKRFVRNLLSFPEVDVSLIGLFQLTGFKQIGLPIEKTLTSKTTYTFKLKLWHFVNSITAFSAKPLQYIFFIGLVIISVGGILSIFLILYILFKGNTPPGWLSVIASIWFIGGLILVSIGVIAIYLSKIFIEVKGRPRAIVDTINSKNLSDE
jgi:putative glycosyltransferase